MMFRLGVNYWPVSSAMYWWQRFDRREVVRDFALVSNAGLDSVRIFLLWEDFQPEAGSISEPALANLEQVADAAAENRLSLIVTLFTGHMSGVNWIPQWALGADSAPTRFRTMAGGGIVRAASRNWYTDNVIREAQVRLAGEVASRMRGKPAVWAYDLGNENSNCVVPPARESAVSWLQEVAGAIRSADPERSITIGLHMEDLEEDRKLGPAEAATVSDFLCMHGYPLYASWANGPTDEMLLPFLGRVTQWLSGSNQDLLFEEFGAPTLPAQNACGPRSAKPASIQLLDEHEAAEFTDRALHALRTAGFLGAMLWCFGDYQAHLTSLPPMDEAPHECSFGLWRADYSEKPTVAIIERFSGTDRKMTATDYGWIDIARDDFYGDPLGNLRRLYPRFQESRNP